ncbi:alcohol dehydrogenase catalytic domain-containing protein [Pseudarthrobacter raffinosi]|uniref:alcohol dehydrogenase catalytic domain-containing protein n=1 Tax=Pseudarthrobacter raffinosi TaxID=2953651 RepID=UPI00208EBD7E|nr:alcohol dehydrogenase catalytic domain-containing protein [Pseudarthrobacter sp. MDT3-9]MCO4253260.1 alcohol dehydrogenase catalytic domain-containing protein [Pseudarthrobacter sp. MDT3-9]
MTTTRPGMSALRWHSQKDIRLETIERPASPEGSDLLIRVEAAGICGTDIEEWQHGPINIAMTPHPLTGRSAPLTLGHEFCGTVVASGPTAAIKTGTRVAVEVNLSCGICQRCRTGYTQQCEQLGSLGLHGDGGLADFAVVPEHICVPIPPEMPALDAVLAEPLAVAIRAVRLSNIAAGDNVTVLGGGTIGQLAARVANRRGAQVTLIEPHAARRTVAAAAGIRAISPDEETTPENHAPADVTLECAGYKGAVKDAMRLTRAGGSIAVLGVSSHNLTLSAWDLIKHEQQLLGVLSHTLADFTEAVTLLSEHQLNVQGIVTGVVPLSDSIEGAFTVLRDRPSDHLKIVIVP